MQGVRIFEADAARLPGLHHAGRQGPLRGRRLGAGQRRAHDIRQAETSARTSTEMPSLRWPTEITQEMVSVALLKPDRMSTIDLFQYIRHLEANGQTSQRYEIEFWRKVFYPLSCLVMVVLALPFAYLHFRRRHHQLRVRRRADRHQLLPAEQRVRLHRQPAELAALAHGGAPG
jgi:lipopolysaccharide export system permease protein